MQRKCSIQVIFFLILFFICSCTGQNYSEPKNIVEKAEQIHASAGLPVAIHYLETAARQAPEIRKEILPTLLFLKSEYYFENSRFDSGVIYNDSLLSFLEINKIAGNYPKEYVKALNNKGNDLFDSGSHQKAFECYFKCREFAQSRHDICLKGDQSYHLGMVCYRQQKFQEAVIYFRQAFSEIGACNDRKDDKRPYFRRQEILNNIGLSFAQINTPESLDSAEYYYKEGLTFIDSIEQNVTPDSSGKAFLMVARAVIWGNRARVFMQNHQLDSAEKYLLKSIEINSKPGNDNHDAWYSRVRLAEVFYLGGKFRECNALLDLIGDSLDDKVPPAGASWYWRLRYKLAREAGRVNEALLALENQKKADDLLEKNVQQLKGTDYARMLNEQETSFQIQLLKKDNQLNKLSLWITIALSLVALAIIVLIYNYYRKSAKNVATLVRLNKQVREQKRQISVALDEVQHINEEKDRILRIVAHDLRTPIGGIIMIGNLMLAEEIDEEKKEELNMIVSAGQSLLALTSELLEFSDLHNSKKTVSPPERFNVIELTRQVVGLLDYKAREKNQELQLSIARQQIFIEAHREKIIRVLSNLITNAIKFSPEKSPICISVIVNDGKCTVSVQDKGIGIPQRLVDKVFEPFTSARRQGTGGEKSFGLGLSICKSIISAEGGEIYVVSKEGEGSTFSFELAECK